MCYAVFIAYYFFVTLDNVVLKRSKKMGFYKDNSLVQSPILIGKRSRQSKYAVELLPSPITEGITENQNSVIVNNICVSWTEDKSKLVLQDVSFNLNPVST